MFHVMPCVVFGAKVPGVPAFDPVLQRVSFIMFCVSYVVSRVPCPFRASQTCEVSTLAFPSRFTGGRNVACVRMPSFLSSP